MAVAQRRYSRFHHSTHFSELDSRVGSASRVEGQLNELQKRNAPSSTALSRIGCGADRVVH